MDIGNLSPSEPAPRSVLGIPAHAGIQWSPKSAYFRLKAPTFGGSTTYWIPDQARYDDVGLTGQAVIKTRKSRFAQQ
jgi:hypothetical protein